MRGEVGQDVGAHSAPHPIGAPSCDRCDAFEHIVDVSLEEVILKLEHTSAHAFVVWNLYSELRLHKMPEARPRLVHGKVALWNYRRKTPAKAGAIRERAVGP